MAKTNMPKWPDWATVYKRWRTHSVPDVSIHPFDFRRHFPGSPWVRLRDGSQLLVLSNPEQTTAYHLAVWLAGRSAEFIAAYKLNAWCITNDCDFFRIEVIDQYFKSQNDSVGGWWHPNSRHLLPFIEGMRQNYWAPRKPYYEEPDEWGQFVDLAAEKWIDVANHLGILRVPDFMEINSPERKAADAFYSRQQEERELTEFERLSKKFSHQVGHLASLAENPIVFVEGKLDVAYLTKAIRVFLGEKSLSQIEICQIGNEDSFGGIGGGKDSLNRAYQFLAANTHIIKRKILLLYDFDSNKHDSNHKNLFVRSLPRNERNDKIRKGIENLLPKELFEPKFYTSKKKYGDYGEVTEIQSFDKERFCRYICKERVVDPRQERADFGNFESVLALIFKTILPS